MHETVTELTWDQLIQDPSLQDLPYKIELNDEGQITMSPTGRTHSAVQADIILELRRLHPDSGRVLGETPVRSGVGQSVIVTDAAWVSDARWAAYVGDGPCSPAPEICAQIQSPSNSNRQMLAKVRRYFEAGAAEVWVVDLVGNKTVHRSQTS